MIRNILETIIETENTDMELALNEINLAKQSEQRIIVPAYFAKQFGLAVSNAAFRKADMSGYTKRGSIWWKDNA